MKLLVPFAFALLKGMDIIPLVIISARVLQNICLESIGVPNGIELYNELEEEQIMNQNNLNPNENHINRDLAAAK